VGHFRGSENPDTFNSIPISGILKKNIFKKREKIATQKQALKSPQSTINPPQTHHEFTIKKHHIFTNPLQKRQQKSRKLRSRKTSQKQIRRR
jgi:hypothetical protein